MSAVTLASECLRSYGWLQTVDRGERTLRAISCEEAHMSLESQPPSG